MLSERFQEQIARIAALTATVQQQRGARDTFIQTQFPLLDAAFVSMVDSAVGLDSHLVVTHTPAIDVVTGHTFASLTKTITEVKSTLYGAPETVTFTPSLESRDVDQFGVIRITTDSVPDSTVADPGSLIFAAMLTRGILMRGKTVAGLVVTDGGSFTQLSSGLLENFLAALFIRS